MIWLAPLFGIIVGLSIGLTGGGGAIFAVPMLVYGLHLSPPEAMGISRIAVGLTALIGFFAHWQRGRVELRTGLIFAMAGVLVAPLGMRLALELPMKELMLLFAALMLIVAVQLWRTAKNPAEGPGAEVSELPERDYLESGLPERDSTECENSDTRDTRASGGEQAVRTLSSPAKRRACRSGASGSLVLNSRCALLLLAAGSFTGLLVGLFGAGGFIVVPALMAFSDMPIHRAISTAPLVVALINLSGTVSYLADGQTVDPWTTGLFIGGGMAGLSLGQVVGGRLSGAKMQRLFASLILLAAAFVVVRVLRS